jgi:2-haloacid dehalogenase
MAREEIRVATFDCYGTLIDWEGGLGSFLYDMARRRGDADPGPGRALRERWEEIQFEAIQGPYRRYRQILHDSLREWADSSGYGFAEDDGEALARAMESWQPFPDTVPALRRAKAAGLRLVIVSNTDRAIMEHTLRQLELDFDGLVLAEDCRAYKPSPRVFERALAEVGEVADRMLHVAFGFRYDIGPAKRLGLRTAWVNRHGERRLDGASPEHEWRDLWGLAELAETA